VLPGSENEIDVGLLTGLGLVALIAYLWPATPGLWRALWLAPAAILLWRLVGAGSRGALLGAAIAVAVALALQLWRPRTRGPALALLAILVALAPIAWTSSSPDARAKYTAVLQLSGDGPAAALDAGGGERSEIAAAATQIFLDNPMGVGTDGYAPLSGWDRPHNIVLELGSELGVAGIAVFALLLAGVAAAVLPQVRRAGAPAEAIAATALLVVPLTVAFSSFDLNDNRMLWLCLGVALSVPQIARAARR
jgi:O-antigen ligase